MKKLNHRVFWMMGILGLICMLLYLFVPFSMQTAAFILGRRIPLLLVMVLVAIAVSSSTMVFQTMTQNNILTPDLLGYSQLYGLLQVLAVYFLGSSSFLVVNKTLNVLFVGTCLILLSGGLMYALLRKWKDDLFTMLLFGSVLSMLYRSLSNTLQLMMDPNEFTVAQSKLIASITTVNKEVLVIGFILLALAHIWLVKRFKVLDVMMLGESQAKSLGVDTKAFQRQGLFFVGICVSVATAMVGPLVFLGLIAINGARFLVKTYHHKQIWLLSILLSIILMIGGQFFIERVAGYNVTLSVILNLVGGFYILWVIFRKKGL